MSNNIKEEIRKVEEAGIDVVVTNNGKLEHVTGGINNSPNFCDSCEYLRFVPDPDSNDWSRLDDQKAICQKMEGMITGSIHQPSEMIYISKPIWCPFLGRELTKKEKKDYDSKLYHARFFYKT